MTWPETHRGVFAISVAADLAGLHPQTLRIYEREGLIAPIRSAGGTRRYSGRDVERLREIAALTGAGLNLAGVKHAFALQAEIDRLRAIIESLGGQPALYDERRMGARDE